MTNPNKQQYKAFGWPFFRLVGILVALVLVLTAIVEVRFPKQVMTEDCTVVAIGEAAVKQSPRAKWVMGEGGNPKHTILVRCGFLGSVKINDVDAFRYGDVAAGTPAEVSRLLYRVLPTRWRFQIHHPKQGTPLPALGVAQ